MGLVFQGYTLNCSKSAMSNDFSLPEWKDFGSLFLTGLKAFFISFLYFLPILIIVLAVAGAALFSLFSGLGSPTGLIMHEVTGSDVVLPPSLPANDGAGARDSDFSELFGLILGLGIALVIIIPLFIVIALMVPNAILNFVKNDRFGSAFDFGAVFRKTFRWKYFNSLGLIFIYSIGVFIISVVPAIILTLLENLPGFLGILFTALHQLLSIIVNVILGITVATILGQAFSEE
ncbi:DUF4013 domain-containing protein [Candidatus Woesearchaeota archaeon]|nr:DUF4013 domain-containing protein [Candidatus Woesearchaeota archaeon]